MRSLLKIFNRSSIFCLRGMILFATGAHADAANMALEADSPALSKAAQPGDLLMAEMPPEQNYDEVMRKELLDSQRLGSAGLIRFIARNPDHPLADEARRLLAAHTEPMRPIPGDSDADVAAAFDAARRAGSAEELVAFSQRYRGHPLAYEALRMRDALLGR